MDKLTFNTHKQFRNLLDAVAADYVSWPSGSDTTRPDNSGLGPSVGDDAAPALLTALGPSVGDDITAPSLTMLGPSVGDDGVPV